MPEAWMSDFIRWLTSVTGAEYRFVVMSYLTIIVMCLSCGMMGALVVGNRMAFFSDAMAHCAFAGIALGVLSVILADGDREMTTWLVPLVMVLFGVAVGAGMVFVRDNTGLAHDTVIGVFFALAMGVAAMLTTVIEKHSSINLETFLFGRLNLVQEADLIFLCGTLLLVTGVFVWRYNQFTFASFNPSLGRTRRMTVTFNNYLFIILLALVVNLSLKAVGALLINALLVVPGATAANLSRNVRQMFWLTIAFCLGSGLIGCWLSSELTITVKKQDTNFHASGMIVVVCVGFFFASMVGVAVWNRFAPIFGGKVFLRPRHSHGPGDPCSMDHPFGQCP
jgi:zinc transport system permease protein